jgi:hypothetical protein
MPLARLQEDGLHSTEADLATLRKMGLTGNMPGGGSSQPIDGAVNAD